jgi:hypothetical protein
LGETLRRRRQARTFRLFGIMATGLFAASGCESYRVATEYAENVVLVDDYGRPVERRDISVSSVTDSTAMADC